MRRGCTTVCCLAVAVLAGCGAPSLRVGPASPATPAATVRSQPASQLRFQDVVAGLRASALVERGDLAATSGCRPCLGRGPVVPAPDRGHPLQLVTVTPANEGGASAAYVVGVREHRVRVWWALSGENLLVTLQPDGLVARSDVSPPDGPQSVTTGTRTVVYRWSGSRLVERSGRTTAVGGRRG